MTIINLSLLCAFMDIDVVVIGLNSAPTLQKCLQAAFSNHYTQGKVNYFYVDGGSTDNSLAIAQQFPQFTILKIAQEHPTPSAGRNMGWQHGKAPLVQFLDSDTELNPDWFNKAVPLIEPKDIAAISGFLKELNPNQSIYNWFCGHEWNSQPGYSETFGGNVLIKREVLEKSKGYDNDLVAGEDPELSRRIRQLGWKILHSDEPMASHDLDTQTLIKYLKRSYRTGYAYGLLFDRHHIWKPEVLRIVVRSLLFFLFLILSLLYSWWFLIPALVFLFFPRLFRVKSISKNMRLTMEEASLYSWHASIIVIPQFFGIIRYYYGKWFNKPLRNKRC